MTLSEIVEISGEEGNFDVELLKHPRYVDMEKCIACGTCIEGCPMEAISFVDERAFIEDDKCIRCYCCHEICPEEAIELRSSWLYQLVNPV